MEREDVPVPANCQDEHKQTYIDNFLRATKGTGRLVLFAGDQKIEHLNEDFAGEDIAEADANPTHLFRIASEADIGCFAAQHGIISRYGPFYRDVPYLVKMNSKTNLVKGEPRSLSLVDIEDVLDLREGGLDVVGVGYTVYLGSEHEAEMLSEAGRLIADAHSYGLLAVIWMYPRGAAVTDEKSPDIIAGAAGVACSLGADFVKVNQPQKAGKKDPALLGAAVEAAGMTGIIVSGGAATDPGKFLHLAWEQVHEHGAAGTATGRNVHQRPYEEAVRMCNALSAIVYRNWSTHDAWLVYTGQKRYD